MSSASGDGCAKIYNLSLRKLSSNSHKMTSEIVWNAFYVHALLLHHARRDSHLQVPHHGEQSDRLATALKVRNEQMVGVGQPQWAHACDQCEKLVEVEEPASGRSAWGASLPGWCAVSDVDIMKGRLSACVMDGVCIGHPRCQVYHCTERLLSPRDRYCESHRAFDTVCAIQGCDLPCTDGKRTCSTKGHRAVEQERRRRGRAMFELKRRMQARDVASSIRAVPSVDPSPSFLDDPDLDDPAWTSNVERKKTHKRAPRIKSTLTRRWTHNEQLLVRPCNVIVSRATFYEAESLPNCRVSGGAPDMHKPADTPCSCFSTRASLDTSRARDHRLSSSTTTASSSRTLSTWMTSTCSTWVSLSMCSMRSTSIRSPMTTVRSTAIRRGFRN